MLIKLVEVIPQLSVFFWNLESFLIEIFNVAAFFPARSQHFKHKL